MSASKANSVKLSVQTGDQATEIYVIDGQFQLVGRGLGKLDISLAPGIYKVKVRAGFVTEEEYVILREGDTPVVKQFSAMTFSSPVPLWNTVKTHEYHVEAAIRECTRTHVSVGQGSWIYVFARDWTPTYRTGRPMPQRGFQHPATGLTLLTEHGSPVADLAQQSTTNATQMLPGQDPWAGCNIQLDPGCYRLSLELPSGDRLEQTLVSSPGWQTQVFLLQRNYGEAPSDQRADLSGSAILLSKQLRFDPNSESIRLTELARQGLTNRRQVLPKEVTRQMLWEKYENPILGIYGAHLQLLSNTQGLNTIETVVNNLRRLLGAPHPDVEALALGLQSDARTSYVFNIPPMLRRSWSLVLEATVRKPSLVPADSFAAQVAPHLWGDDPWLIWTRPVASARDLSPASSLTSESEAESSDYEQVLKTYLLPPTKQSRSRRASIEENKERGTGPVMFDVSAEFAPSDEMLTESLPSSLDDSQAQRLVGLLGIPRASVENLLIKLNKKP
jgi:hypothetical protein